MKGLGLSLVFWSYASLAAAAMASTNSHPNFIVILTDDQDQQMDSLKYMKHVRELLIQQGTTFPHHYCTVAVCCPARASLWTGKTAHNTNITDLIPPFGNSQIHWIFPGSHGLTICRRISQILRAGLASEMASYLASAIWIQDLFLRKALEPS